MNFHVLTLFPEMIENGMNTSITGRAITKGCLLYTSVKGKKIVSILSGGNMDVITMSSVVQHGLIQRDRIFTVSVLMMHRSSKTAKLPLIITNVWDAEDASASVLRMRFLLLPMNPMIS